ncbi:MAG: adenylate/guanylate cyclase domain-containing protein [Candidatus Rokubacteria bacterium]|nr:adenylate/guanylate cyclase domain-containing protein [Candidatus Rokubacteria bacterium]
MGLLHSIVTKNIGLFLLILLVAIVPLALRYDQDSRDAEIQMLASKLEFFAQRGESWIDASAIAKLQRPEDKDTDAYRTLLATLRRIEREFAVDNAVVMRREPDGTYTYVAVGHDGFAIREPVGIHTLFPATYRATNDTWAAGEMMHSQLFGGRVGDTDYDQFLQINTPLKRDGAVVAILMLNKFANPVAAAVRARTARVVALSAALVAVGLALFALVSARMLRPLKQLTAAAGQVAGGDLSVALPPVTRDEVGRLSRAFAGMVEGLRQRNFIRDTFGRYVTREVVDELLGSPDGLKLGGEVRVVTILVTDLRGFTALAATLRPDEVLDILNRYLERMVAVLQRYRGTIDEIQGDGLLTFFGAPLAAPDDTARAVGCAVEMQRALDDFNVEQRRLGRPELSMGIGINTGEVVIGNIGSERRTKYGAVGTAINMAYRIESETVGGQILVSEETYRRVQDVVRVRGTLTVALKGLDHPLTLYDVAGVGGEHQVSLRDAADDTLVALHAPLTVACYLIEGKTVSPTSIAASLVAVGANSADLLLEAPVAERSNVKILVTPAAGGSAHEVYGKIVALHEGHARLAFTSISDDARGYLSEQAHGAGV